MIGCKWDCAVVASVCVCVCVCVHVCLCVGIMYGCVLCIFYIRFIACPITVKLLQALQ